MAGGVRIYRFDGPPPVTPDDPCLDDGPYLTGLVPENPSLPFGPTDEIRAVFDRHVPDIRWNARGTGFARRGKFQMQVVMPSGDSGFISLGLDDYSTAAALLRLIEAERPDWYTSWFDGKWLRDTPAPKV
ncbi:hypothetical protein [Antarctobacter heliothermus]|uniref:Uncharacterized protein n=1 Tax=Antarctobacter heliothermus TaxID=74033 RepID=A0A239GHA0_9RHOB|nr:hypothetical protein [Antarctobacter heliothermus]SNS68265.1 hypothetical protein SAMN04488078_102638 [Antarctobacter heliothermus]